MNLDDVRMIVQAVDGRDRPSPLLLPGSVGQVGSGGVIEVVMDSDDEGSSIEARSLFADVAPGDRVMVLFDPPRGVYAVGLIGRTVEAGQLVAYQRDVVEAEAYGTGSTQVLSYSTGTVQWRAGRYYDLRLSVSIDLDTVDTAAVTVTGQTEVTSAPIVNAGVAQFTSVWGTPNGALTGGAEGTLHFSRLMLLSQAFSQSVDVTVTTNTTGAGGDIDVTCELAVFDAGPELPVVT